MEELPIEIIETIASYIAPHQLLRLRQTSSKIYTKTNGYCSRTLFHTLNTDLSLDELHYLTTGFVNNPQLTGGIHTLRVQLKDVARGLGHDYHWNRKKRGEHLVLPCDGFEALHKLFGHYLSNCKTLQLHARDRQSEIDGPDDQLEPADVLELILLLAQQIPNFRPQTLEIGSPLRSDGPSRAKGTHLSTERLSHTTIKDPDVRAMLADLEHLNMHLVYPDELIASGWLDEFLGALDKLRTISLDLDMNWAELAAVQSLLGHVRCPDLQDARLRRFKTTPHFLLSLLQPCAANLSALYLNTITLVAPPGAADDEAWKPWLRDLPSHFPRLTRLELDLLTTVYPGGRRTHLHFEDFPGFSLPVIDDDEEEYYGEESVSKGLRDRTYTYTAPKEESAAAGEEDMVFELAPHGWARPDQLVFPGIGYEGSEMERAVEFMWEHAKEMSMF